MRWRDEAKIRHRQGQNHQSTGFVQIFGSKLDFFQTFFQTKFSTSISDQPCPLVEWRRLSKLILIVEVLTVSIISP